MFNFHKVLFLLQSRKFCGLLRQFWRPWRFPSVLRHNVAPVEADVTHQISTSATNSGSTWKLFVVRCLSAILRVVKSAQQLSTLTRGGLASKLLSIVYVPEFCHISSLPSQRGDDSRHTAVEAEAVQLDAANFTENVAKSILWAARPSCPRLTPV